MKVLDRYGIRATVALNSNVCAQHPEIIEEGQKRKWEWMGHNETNTKRLNEVPAEEERRIIHDSLGTIQRATGKRPAGWLGSGLQETWHSLDLLAVEGGKYVGDWTNDDQPYRMNLEGGRQLVSVPYSIELNDKLAFEKHSRTAAEFADMIRRQFDVLYEEGAESGRVMAIALHPYLIGMPHRIGALDAALEYVCRHDGVWRATGEEIASHFLAQAAPR
jgi:peptidoglycan/xylan/chitin deacetylase (PgdA/CDA1 family)